VLPRLLAAGVGIMGSATLGLAVIGPLGTASGLPLLLQFVAFLGLLPALMGLFVSPAVGEAGRRIAERESRAMRPHRPVRR
jgi:hypothetical protein